MFIEFHDIDDHSPFLLNTEQIISVYLDDDAETVVLMTDGKWHVAESYDEVKDLIKND